MSPIYILRCHCGYEIDYLFSLNWEKEAKTIQCPICKRAKWKKVPTVPGLVKLKEPWN